MKFKIGSAVVILALFSFAGCASSSFEMKEHDRSDSQWSGTAILLNYDLDPSQPCTLALKNGVGDLQYTVGLADHGHSILVDIPAGTYSGKTLSCPQFKTWDLDHFLKGPFRIEEGKINYLGKVDFLFTSAPVGMTVKAGGQASATRSLIADALPEGWRKALFNPFTHQPIPIDALVKKDVYQVDIKTTYELKPGESGPSTKGLEASIGECDELEQRKFPYRLGTLTYTATYEGQKLIGIEKQDHHSFSDEFTSCLDRSFHDFTPAKGTRFKVVVTL